MINVHAMRRSTVASSALPRGRRHPGSRGFTLIELLTIVFIIGILLVIALPTYLNYSNRAKLAEALGLSAPVRRAVDEYWATHGDLPDSSSVAAVGPAADYSGRYVAGITVIQDGVIQISLDDASLNFGHLLLTPTTAGSSKVLIWVCSSSDIAPQHLPRDCR